MDLKIYNGRSYFYQWDSNQKFIVEDDHVNELHFTNDSQEDASVIFCYESEGVKYCDVPNSYLEKNGILTVYAFTYENGNYTKNTFRFNVIERPKPNDYVIEEEDINRWGELDNKINVTKDELENEIDELENEIDDLGKKLDIHKHDVLYDKLGSSYTALENAKTYTDDVASRKANAYHKHKIKDIDLLQDELDKKTPYGHSHMDLSTRITEVEQGKANVYHVHSEYYGKTDVNRLLNNKADTSHNHDSSYYKKTEVDSLLKNATVSDEKIASSVEKYLEENPIEIPSDVITKEEFESKQPLIGTITSSNGKLSCSLTNDEIFNAGKEKRQVVLYKGSIRYDLESYGNDWSYFSSIYSERCIHYLEIHRSGLVRESSIVFQESQPSGLSTTNKTVTGAINELKESIDDTNDKIDKKTVSWNSVTNKPFGNVVEITDTLTFNGNLEGKETIQFDIGTYLVKVSDSSPTIEQMIGSVIRFYDPNTNESGEITVTQDMIQGGEGAYFVVVTLNEQYQNIPFVLVNANNNYNDYPKGINVVCALNLGWVSSIKFNEKCVEGDVLKPIPNEYLPSHLQFGGEKTYLIPEGTMSTYNEEGGENVALVELPSLDVVDVNSSLFVKIGGVEYETTIKQEPEDFGDALMFGNTDLLLEAGDTGEPFVGAIAEDDGMIGITLILYVGIYGTESIPVSVWQGEEKIDNKYLDLDWIPSKKNVTKELGEIVHEGTYEFTNSEYWKNFDVSWIESLTIGCSYIVNWNGTKYETQYNKFSVVDGTTTVELYYLGNGAKLNDDTNGDAAGNCEDTGEPFRFAIVYLNGERFTKYITRNYNTDETVTVTVQELIKKPIPIPTEFLPIFGSTEIENVLIEEGTYELNGEEMGMQTINFVDVPKRTNDTFIVSWNGTEYEYHTLTTIQYNENTTWHIFGNIGAMNETLGTNYPITNEPFIGAYVEFADGSQQKNIVIVPLDGSTSANIKIWQEKENNLLIQSPNGKIFKLVVDDDGNLSTVAI